MTEQEAKDLLIRIDERVTHILDNQAAHEKVHCRLDRDVLSLKQWRWSWMGAMALLVFLINWLSRVMVR